VIPAVGLTPQLVSQFETVRAIPDSYHALKDVAHVPFALYLLLSQVDNGTATLELLAAVDEPPGKRLDPSEQELDEGSDLPQDDRGRLIPFHDVLKAEGLRLGIPIQMVRPYTYTGERARRKKKSDTASGAPMQDEATRAWNLHTALYYKAGGVPWRLLRNPADLATCFVGISFYKSLDSERILTSVAQVNERGEGVIVKGAQAELSKDDRQPHLTEADAQTLLANAVDVYRKEHRTMPARLVVHKTSKMTDGEILGFRAASEENMIDVVIQGCMFRVHWNCLLQALKRRSSSSLRNSYPSPN